MPSARTLIGRSNCAGDDTLVRLRGRHLLRDVRRLAELEAVVTPFGLLRIHNSYVVNLERVLEIRPREAGSRDGSRTHAGFDSRPSSGPAGCTR